MGQAGLCVALTLLLVLLWDPVTRSCAGQNETIDYYVVRCQHVRLLGWTTDEPPSPIYSMRDPQDGTTTRTEWWMSGEALLPGDVTWWEIDSVDTAGNRSGNACF